LHQSGSLVRIEAADPDRVRLVVVRDAVAGAEIEEVLAVG